MHDSNSIDEAVDATRRTRLASERTELAWWRTGLTAMAVAYAVGRVVPELEDRTTRWPYVAGGIAFAVYGVAVMLYGSMRNRTVQRALAAGEFPEQPRVAHAAIAFGGVVLGLLTVVLVAID
jgi:inner membrane protein YidH